jgi:hypothetical protein
MRAIQVPPKTDGRRACTGHRWNDHAQAKLRCPSGKMNYLPGRAIFDAVEMAGQISSAPIASELQWLGLNSMSF